MKNSRLDILIYGHDGRGLGHVSRSVAIGMALRRLYPHLKVCVLSGCRQTQELIGQAPLDWMKLPAYDTVVIEGKSTGIDGPSGFADRELGELRAQQIKQIIGHYRPRLVLVDHQPQGKHRELVPAITAEGVDRPLWVLGMRGVVGTVSQTRTEQAIELFAQHYRALLWYGDRSVLGSDHLEHLRDRFGSEPLECGYVSRLIELMSFSNPAGVRTSGCTISIPWFGEHTVRFFDTLVEALGLLGPGYGRIQIFVGSDDLSPLKKKLEGLGFCRVEPFGTRYLEALCSSRSAVIFGGYNSLVDVLSVGVPALVVRREMQDQEQQEHLTALLDSVGGRLRAVAEHPGSVEQLYQELVALMNTSLDPFDLPVNLGGAEKAARVIKELI